MNRLVLSSSALMLTLTLCAAVQAGPEKSQSGGPGGSHSRSHPDLHPGHPRAGDSARLDARKAGLQVAGKSAKYDDSKLGKRRGNKPRELNGVGGRRHKYFDRARIVKHNGPRKTFKKYASHRNYHKKYGKAFSYYSGSERRRGWYYPGRKHFHWSYCSWNSQYHRWFFYDDCTSAYYYYCARHSCYLPADCGCSTCFEEEDDSDTPPCYEDCDDCDPDDDDDGDCGGTDDGNDCRRDA